MVRRYSIAPAVSNRSSRTTWDACMLHRPLASAKIFTMAWLFTVLDSMCSISSTVVVTTRSYTVSFCDFEIEVKRQGERWDSLARFCLGMAPVQWGKSRLDGA